jgi:hypothetical protein
VNGMDESNTNIEQSQYNSEDERIKRMEKNIEKAYSFFAKSAFARMYEPLVCVRMDMNQFLTDDERRVCDMYENNIYSDINSYEGRRRGIKISFIKNYMLKLFDLMKAHNMGIATKKRRFN